MRLKCDGCELKETAAAAAVSDRGHPFHGDVGRPLLSGQGICHVGEMRG